MNSVLKIFLCIVLFIQLFLIIKTIRRKNMSMKYASIWIIIIVLMFAFVIFPTVLIDLSKLFGFEATSNMVFLLGFFAMFYMAFIQTISISKLKNEIVNLVQEISMLKKEVNDGKKD